MLFKHVVVVISKWVVQEEKPEERKVEKKVVVDQELLQVRTEQFLVPFSRCTCTADFYILLDFRLLNFANMPNVVLFSSCSHIGTLTRTEWGISRSYYSLELPSICNSACSCSGQIFSLISCMKDILIPDVIHL